jgi:uncharacterized protein YecT (DUF1311 family)
MKKLIYLLIISSLTLLTASFKTESRAQMAPTLDPCPRYREADAEMNKVYQQIFKAYKPTGPFLQKLKTAQRAWLTYRDAHLESLYPATDKQTAYGSAYRDCACQAMAELTARRTEELHRWVKGTYEGDVCSGSVKIND